MYTISTKNPMRLIGNYLSSNPTSNPGPNPGLGSFSQFATYRSSPKIMKVNAPKSSPPRRGSSRKKYSDDSVQFDYKSQQGGFELGNRRGRFKQIFSIQVTHRLLSLKLLLIRLMANNCRLLQTEDYKR
jgi:hypothetical protein